MQTDQEGWKTGVDGAGRMMRGIGAPCHLPLIVMTGTHAPTAPTAAVGPLLRMRPGADRPETWILLPGTLSGVWRIPHCLGPLHVIQAGSGGMMTRRGGLQQMIMLREGGWVPMSMLPGVLPPLRPFPLPDSAPHLTQLLAIAGLSLAMMEAEAVSAQLPLPLPRLWRAGDTGTMGLNGEGLPRSLWIAGRGRLPERSPRRLLAGTVADVTVTTVRRGSRKVAGVHPVPAVALGVG